MTSCPDSASPVDLASTRRGVSAKSSMILARSTNMVAKVAGHPIQMAWCAGAMRALAVSFRSEQRNCRFHSVTPTHGYLAIDGLHELTLTSITGMSLASRGGKGLITRLRETVSSAW